MAPKAQAQESAKTTKLNKDGTPRKKNAPQKRWMDRYADQAYDWAQQGMNDNQIARMIDVPTPTFFNWKKEHPELNEALEEARAGKTKNTTTGVEMFKDYVFNRLPDDLQEIWERIVGPQKGPGKKTWDEQNANKEVLIELERKGEMARMRLWWQAFFHFGYNPYQACRCLNMARESYDAWKKNPDFLAIYNETQTHKKFMFQGKLIELVQKGDPQAVLFVNKTINKDWGYNERIDVNLSGEVTHNHNVVSVSELNIDFETRKQMLEKLQQKQDAIQLESQDGITYEAADTPHKKLVSVLVQKKKKAEVEDED